jgi:F-type H+-transporting ATPase subunit b
MMAIQLSVILASGSLVDLDGTFFVQLGVFLIMLVILRSLVFKPIVRLIDARHEATVGAMKTAEKLTEEAASLSVEVEKKLAGARADATKVRNETLERAKKQEREIGNVAREKAGRVVGDMRVRVASDMKNVQQKLEEETRSMAVFLSEKILDRKL